MTAITYTGPAIEASVPFEVRRHLQLIYQKLGNHTQAFAIQQQNISNIKSGTSTTVVESAGGGGSVTPSTASGIAVNDQSGVTSYATIPGDNDALIVLSDASPIAVTLTAQTPPWGCFIANEGIGTATLTPGVVGSSSSTISYAGNPGASSMPLLGGYGCVVAFDGSNWWALTMPIVPVNFPAVTHEFLTAYDAATGAFTAAQPAFTDISGVASPAQLPTPTASTIGGVEAAGPTAHQWINEIDTSGVPHLSQPDFSDLSGTAANSQLPATSVPLSGTSASLGGSAMTAGQTISVTVTVTGAASGMVAMCNPQTYPGDGFVWDSYVSAANTVTVRLTAALAGTPTASVYSVRILQ